MAGGKTNWVAIWISAAVVVLLVAVGAIVVWMNNQATAPAEAPASASIDETTGAIRLGEGPDVLQTYVDFMCPFCGQFEDSWGETVADQVSQGSMTLEVFPVSILDSQSQGTEFSTRAANAMYCVAEDNPDAAYPFMDLMFSNQPREATPGLTDEEIVSFAERAGASGAAECIADRTYADFVDQTTEQLPGGGTPAVLLNGETLNWQATPEQELLPRLQG
ncbi:thioredoxin domain-containing protein [Microbacterium sp.]|uniref:DsbA family protein n=1 Tax=Microbacterium sp. TaxID=51671 RepID=UPI002811278E|nr:thioredoxin domain-containing protein [Microbacterium sp.]